MAKTNRDEFTEKTKRILEKRSGNICSNPECKQGTSGPHSDPGKATSIGRAAHISAAGKGGPRFDENLTSEERKSILNGVWLCANCADLVDKDKLKFPESLLLQWREEAESRASQEIKRSPNESVTVNGWDCPLCGTFVAEGKYICLGCQAEVCYGATLKGRKEAGQFGLGVGAFIGFFLWYAIHFAISWLENQFSIQILPTGLHAIKVLAIGGGLVAIVAFVGAHFAIKHVKAKYEGKQPRFFKVRLT